MNKDTTNQIAISLTDKGNNTNRTNALSKVRKILSDKVGNPRVIKEVHTDALDFYQIEFINNENRRLFLDETNKIPLGTTGMSNIEIK